MKIQSSFFVMFAYGLMCLGQFLFSSVQVYKDIPVSVHIIPVNFWYLLLLMGLAFIMDMLKLYVSGGEEY